MTLVPKPDLDFQQEQLQVQNNFLKLVSDLMASGEKSRSEIEALKKENETRKLQNECEKNYRKMVEKENVKLNSDLTQKFAEIGMLKDQLSCLAGEKIVWLKRVEDMKEREKAWLEKVDNATLRCTQLEREKTVQCTKLEMEKVAVMAELEIMKGRFINLTERVSNLEDKASSLTNLAGLNGGDNSNSPRRGVQPPAPDVVIIDSDEETPPDFTASKTQASDRNGTPSLKRKIFSSVETNGNNPDGNLLSSRSKMKKLPEFISHSGCSAGNQGCSPSARTNAEKISALRSKDPLIKLSEKKMGSSKGQSSRFLLNCPLDIEDSSNSSESEDNVNVCRLLLTSRTKKTKMWGSREEMQAAIEKDDELSLRAVCALHKEHIFFKNLLSEFFPGLSRSDACRGTKLAEYLMDGNQSGRLMKSVKDLIKNDAKGLDDCKRLTMALSKPLFEIYEKEGDSMFLH